VKTPEVVRLQTNLSCSEDIGQDGLTVEHIAQFAKLWEALAPTQFFDDILDDIKDSITWKLTNNGLYSSLLAYKMQFEGLITSTMPLTVWRLPAKGKTFVWFVNMHGRRID
jgi:hypothetical protein